MEKTSPESLASFVARIATRPSATMVEHKESGKILRFISFLGDPGIEFADQSGATVVVKLGKITPGSQRWPVVFIHEGGRSSFAIIENGVLVQ